MRKIQLVNCEDYALVSDEDYEYLSQWRWYKNPLGYVASTQHVPRLMHIVLMQRMMEELPSGFQIDHANHNRTDNTRENIRVCTCSQNMANIPRNRYRGSSKYKGVSIDKRPNRSKPWKASISIDNKTHHIGVYATEEEAAMAYDQAAYERFGEFAWLNFPNSSKLTP